MLNNITGCIVDIVQQHALHSAHHTCTQTLFAQTHALARAKEHDTDTQKLATALAATTAEFANLTDDSVKACMSRTRLEVEARKKGIDTSCMTAGLKAIKNAVLGQEQPHEQGVAGAGQAGAGQEPVLLRQLVQVQGEMTTLMKKVVNKEEENKAEYELYGGRKGGVLGLHLFW